MVSDEEDPVSGLTPQQAFDAYWEALHAGDARAQARYIGIFFRRTSPQIRELVQRKIKMIPAYMEAKDVVQDVYMRVLKYGGQKPDNVGGWLFQVTKNLLIELNRKRERRPEVVMSRVTSDDAGELRYLGENESDASPPFRGHTRIERPDSQPLSRAEFRWFMNHAQLQYLAAKDDPAPVPTPMLQRHASAIDWSNVSDSWIHAEAWKRSRNDLSKLIPRLRDLMLFRLHYFDGLDYEQMIVEIGPFMKEWFKELSRSGKAPGRRVAALGDVTKNAAGKAVSIVKAWMCRYAKDNGLRVTSSGWWVTADD